MNLRSEKLFKQQEKMDLRPDPDSWSPTSSNAFDDEGEPPGCLGDHYEGIDPLLKELVEEIESILDKTLSSIWWGMWYVINFDTERLYFYTDFISDDFTVNISLLEKEFDFPEISSNQQTGVVKES